MARKGFFLFRCQHLLGQSLLFYFLSYSRPASRNSSSKQELQRKGQTLEIKHTACNFNPWVLEIAVTHGSVSQMCANSLSYQMATVPNSLLTGTEDMAGHVHLSQQSLEGQLASIMTEFLMQKRMYSCTSHGPFVGSSDEVLSF